MVKMSLLWASPLLFVFVITFLLAFVGLRHWNGTKKSKRRRYPPSLPSLPLVGSLPFLADFAHLPEFFMKKSREFGPIFTFKVGSKLGLVLNSREVVNEALSKQSLSYAGREAVYSEKNLFNKNLKGIAMRKFDMEYRRYHFICMSILRKFGLGIHNLTESRIVLELEDLVDELARTSGVAFNPKALTIAVISNVTSSVLFGRRQNLEKGAFDVVRLTVEYMEHIDAVLDVAPILRFIPKRWGNLQRLKKIQRELNYLLTEEVRKIMTDGAQESFVKSFIEKEGPGYDEENLIVTLRELTIGGSDTFLATMLWSFILLANHPAVQERMQKELDEAVPRGRFASYDDRAKVPYVDASILEIMRIRTVLPLSLPRLTLKDTEVGGYSVPAGTVVFSNLHAIHMDPAVFAEPDKFRPERFLDEENNVAKDLVIPFGLGRRACLGEVLARQELFLTISYLVQRFTIRPPDGVQTIEVGYFGSIIRKPEPFEIRMMPREN